MAVSFKAANTVGSRVQRRSASGARAAAVSRVVRAVKAQVPFQPVNKAISSSSSSRAQTVVAHAATMDRAAATATNSAAVVNQKPCVIITGASSGLGLAAATELAKSGNWHVIMACRDFSKAEMAAKKNNMPAGSYTVMHLDLASMSSVRQFVANYKAAGYRLDALVANAAVYLPTAEEPTMTADGFELSVATNHLGHFLLCNLMLEDLKSAPNGAPKMVIVGSITGNTNTLAGNVPPKADLGDLSGLANGASMIDGQEFNGAKAYKDSKVCNMLTMREMHKRFHESTGVTFASLYPGCIASSGLFRNHVPLFRTLFPVFQQYVTKGFVSEEEAGRRLARVVSDPSLKESGTYWSFKTGTSEPFVNQVSEEVSDAAKGAKLWELSAKAVGL